VPGSNVELLQTMRSGEDGFAGYWIFGEPGSGRSHLLRGCCHAAQQDDISITYIGCEDHAYHPQGLAEALSHAGYFGQLVAIDDISMVIGDLASEALLMTVYQRLHSEAGRLIITHSKPANTLEFATPDLASRMRSLQHFQMSPLSDADKMQLLRGRAENRGFELSQSVLDYWLTRGPRDLGALLIDLETLSSASLAQHKRVTIPLIKQVLGY